MKDINYGVQQYVYNTLGDAIDKIQRMAKEEGILILDDVCDNSIERIETDLIKWDSAVIEADGNEFTIHELRNE